MWCWRPRRQYGGRSFHISNNNKLRQISMRMSSLTTIKAKEDGSRAPQNPSAACQAPAPLHAITSAAPTGCCTIPAGQAPAHHHGQNGGSAHDISDRPTCREKGVANLPQRIPSRPHGVSKLTEHTTRVLILPQPLARRDRPSDEGGAEEDDGRRRADTTHRIHVQPLADTPRDTPQGDGGNLRFDQGRKRASLPRWTRTSIGEILHDLNVGSEFCIRNTWHFLTASENRRVRRDHSIEYAHARKVLHSAQNECRRQLRNWLLFVILAYVNTSKI